MPLVGNAIRVGPNSTRGSAYMGNETVACRFKDRDEDDARVWQARQSANGRWRVWGEEGPVDWTYGTDELEFLTGEYRVTWVIDLAADSHLDAAERALIVQRDPTSIATVFTVQPHLPGGNGVAGIGHAVTIDLEETETERLTGAG